MSVYDLSHLLGPDKRMLCGRTSLLPNVETIGIVKALSDPWEAVKTSSNFSTIHLFVLRTWSAFRGTFSSLSCLAESPVHIMKSMSSLILSPIHLKVSFIRLNGESQSEVSAP